MGFKQRKGSFNPAEKDIMKTVHDRVIFDEGDYLSINIDGNIDL